MSSQYRFQVEDDQGHVLGEPQIRERTAQFQARHHCSAHKGRRVIRVFRTHPSTPPRRVQVYVATWHAAAGKVLGCETYSIE
jgi:hypothetical protein